LAPAAGIAGANWVEHVRWRHKALAMPTASAAA
jgi:hypothetical protein